MHSPSYFKNLISVLKVVSADKAISITIDHFGFQHFDYIGEANVERAMSDCRNPATHEEWELQLIKLRRQVNKFCAEELQTTSCSSMESAPTRSQIEGETSRESLLDKEPAELMVDQYNSDKSEDL